MSEPTREQVEAARAVLAAHDLALRTREQEARREAERARAAARVELLAEVRALWPLDWVAGGGDESVCVELVRAIWLSVCPCPAGYSVQLSTSCDWSYHVVRPTLPEALEAGRAGLRDMVLRLIVAADTVPGVPDAR